MRGQSVRDGAQAAVRGSCQGRQGLNMPVGVDLAAWQKPGITIGQAEKDIPRPEDLTESVSGFQC